MTLFCTLITLVIDTGHSHTNYKVNNRRHVRFTAIFSRHPVAIKMSKEDEKSLNIPTINLFFQHYDAIQKLVAIKRHWN